MSQIEQKEQLFKEKMKILSKIEQTYAKLNDSYVNGQLQLAYSSFQSDNLSK